MGSKTLIGTVRSKLQKGSHGKRTLDGCSVTGLCRCFHVAGRVVGKGRDWKKLAEPRVTKGPEVTSWRGAGETGTEDSTCLGPKTAHVWAGMQTVLFILIFLRNAFPFKTKEETPKKCQRLTGESHVLRQRVAVSF